MNKMFLRSARKFLGLTVMLGFSLACISPWAAAPTPTTFPMANALQTLDSSVAETAAVAATQTALLRPPTLTPTITRAPSQTPAVATPSPTFLFYLVSTATVDLPIEPTSAALNATATYLSVNNLVDIGGIAIPAIPTEKYTHENEWRCIVRYHPNPEVAPNQKFDAYWDVTNTGWDAWTSSTVDFVYKGGLRHDGSTGIQDIRSTVGFGKSISVGAKFVAPRRVGVYNSRYVLRVDATWKTEFCNLKMTVTVK